MNKSIMNESDMTELDIKESDTMFLEDCKYFWRHKEDIERYSSFDLTRLQKLDAPLAKAWTEYKTAKETLNRLAD